MYSTYTVDRDPYIRLTCNIQGESIGLRTDANCTPGKTIACGKACRKPENCKQKNESTSTTKSTKSKAKPQKTLEQIAKEKGKGMLFNAEGGLTKEGRSVMNKAEPTPSKQPKSTANHRDNIFWNPAALRDEARSSAEHFKAPKAERDRIERHVGREYEVQNPVTGEWQRHVVRFWLPPFTSGKEGDFSLNLTDRNGRIIKGANPFQPGTKQFEGFIKAGLIRPYKPELSEELKARDRQKRKKA